MTYFSYLSVDSIATTRDAPREEYEEQVRITRSPLLPSIPLIRVFG